MASVESEVPSWPVADAAVHADGTASLTIHGTERPVTAPNPGAARLELLRLVREELADELGRPVRLRTIDPDGAVGELAVGPDGHVTELTRPRPPRGRPSPTPPMPPAPASVDPAPVDAAPTPPSAPATERVRHVAASPDGEGDGDGTTTDPAAAEPDVDDGTARTPRPIRRSEVHHRQPSPAERAWAWVTESCWSRRRRAPSAPTTGG